MTLVKANTYPDTNNGVGISNLLRNLKKYINNGALS